MLAILFRLQRIGYHTLDAGSSELMMIDEIWKDI